MFQRRNHGEIRKRFEMNEYSIPKLMEVVKAVVRGKFIAINAYIKKKERSQINNPSFHL